MTTVLKLLLNAVVAWIAGLVFITANLYFSNNGADFTFIDLTGFGVILIVVSSLMMLLLYLPSLYKLKRRFGGLHPRIIRVTHRCCLQPSNFSLPGAFDQSKDVSNGGGGIHAGIFGNWD